MADDQDSPNDVGENGEGHEGHEAHEIADYEETTTAIITRANATAPAVLDYEDEPIEDYVVNLVVDEQPDLVPAGQHLSSTIYDGLSETSTAAIAGGKHEGGWSTRKIIFVSLLALLILAIIVTIVFLIITKKFKKNKRTPPPPGQTQTGTTKAVVTKGVSPDSKYQPVPNV